MKLIHLLFSILCIFTWCGACAQINYNGKEFFITLAGNSGYAACSTGTINLNSNHHATVTFFYTNTAETETYTVEPYITTVITLTTSQLVSMSEVDVAELVNNKSLQITSDSNITVTMLGNIAGGKDDDATNVLPTNNQKPSDLYYLVGINRTAAVGDYAPYCFTIVASGDGTVLQITPPVNTAYHDAGIPFNITLNRGQTYEIGTPFVGGTMAETDDDISGTMVKVITSAACAPISVFNSYNLLDITWPIETGPPSCCADILLEQVLPVNTWDTLYGVVALDSISIIRVLSSADNDTVFYNNVPVAVLAQGGFYDTIVAAAYPSVIRCTRPSAIAEFMLCNDYEPVTYPPTMHGDPDMLWVYSMKNGIKEASFKPFPSTDTARYTLVMVSPADNISTVMLNGVSVASSFQPFPAYTGMQYARIDLDTSIENHITSVAPIVAYLTQEENQGSYSYEISDISSFYDFDTIITPTPLGYLIDTIFTCPGVPVLLTADTGSNHMWSTGDTTLSITAVDTGFYTVTEAKVCALDIWKQQFRVLYHHDTTREQQNLSKCAGQSLVLTTDSGTVFLWSTGDTTSFITATDTGYYKVTETIPGTPCTHFRVITYYISGGSTITTSDTTIYKCINSTITLSGDAAIKYQWSTGDTSQSIPVADAGDYTLTELIDSCRATVIDQFHVKDRSFPGALTSTDTAICSGDTIILSSLYPNTIWSTGDTAAQITVSNAGTYTATAIDSCGDKHTAAVTVSTHLCADRYCSLVLPTAFSPNKDGRNDIFRPTYQGEFAHYSLRVFDRFGECVFTSTDVAHGWDGIYNGIQSELGVYFYLCTFDCALKGKVVLKGDVTLVR